MNYPKRCPLCSDSRVRRIPVGRPGELSDFVGGVRSRLFGIRQSGTALWLDRHTMLSRSRSQFFRHRWPIRVKGNGACYLAGSRSNKNQIVRAGTLKRKTRRVPASDGSFISPVERSVKIFFDGLNLGISLIPVSDWR